MKHVKYFGGFKMALALQSWHLQMHQRHKWQRVLIFFWFKTIFQLILWHLVWRCVENFKWPYVEKIIDMTKKKLIGYCWFILAYAWYIFGVKANASLKYEM
jgi:hypothetical protein